MALSDWDITKDSYSGSWQITTGGALDLVAENAGTVSAFLFPKQPGPYPRGINMGVLRTLVRIATWTVDSHPNRWLFCGCHALARPYPLVGMCYGLRVYHPAQQAPEFALVEVSYSSGAPIFTTRLIRPVAAVFPGTSVAGVTFALEYWFWTDAQQVHAEVFRCKASLQMDFTAMETVFNTSIDHDPPTQVFQSEGEGIFAHLTGAYPTAAALAFPSTSLASLS